MKSFFTILLFTIGTLASAQVPQAISYQGIIINPTTGETAANGEHSVKFAFYNAATDGELKWQTSTIPVTTFKGLFTTIIPVPPGAIWDQSLFVELTVDGMVLPTRVQLTTVPYAFKAVSADVALSMNAAGLTGTISSSNLPAELQNFATGTIAGSRIGLGVNASNIDNGTLPSTVLNEHLQDLADGTLSSSRIENLDASKVTTGTFDPARIPNLDVSKITGLTPGGSAPTNIDAANITSGTLAPERLGVVPATNLSGVIPNTNLDEDLVDLADGTLSGQKIGTNIAADNVNVGTLPNGVLDEDLQDLADGTLSGQKIGSNISAANVNTGTLPNTVLDADLQDLADDGVLSASRIENLNTSKITAGTLPVSRGGTGVTTAGNGQLLIGNGTGFNLSTLTAGTGININNSAGAITISSPQANGSTSGYLSSTDWTAFNSKQNAFTPQVANSFFAGPTGGLPPSGPAFRSLVAGDIPSLDANKITSGTISAARLPTNLATANAGNTGQIAYWTSATQLSADGLIWNATTNELNIGGTPTDAAKTGSLNILHEGASHSSGTSMYILNASASGKRGMQMELTGNSAVSNVYGIDIDIEGTGTGNRYGVAIEIESAAANAFSSYGIFSRATGDGTGVHRGVYTIAESANANYNYGIHAAAYEGTTNYGVYGEAAAVANSYAIFSDGNTRIEGNLHVTGTATGNYVSDRKLKREILPMGSTLRKILLLRPSNYYFKNNEFPRLELSDKKQHGLIAQEVEEIFPELITEKIMAEKKDKTGVVAEPELTYKALDYTSLIPILIKGMQEQQAMIDELKQKVERLEGDSKQNGKPRVVRTSNN